MPSWLQGRRYLQVSLLFVAAALGSLPFADLAVYASDPWLELGRIGRGIVTPRWHSLPVLAEAVGHTLAFALIAVAVSVVIGTLLAMVYRFRVVRVFCASIRAVHELFWGLIFMQVFGLSALTGLLAILVPYSGIFARVYAEIFEEQSALPASAVAQRSGVSRWVYTVFAQSLPQLRAYTRYRFECALRSTTILGFIGLPTLGYYFETAFKQGQYSEAACLLWTFFLLIASLRFWLRWQAVPVYLIAAFFLLPESAPVNGSYLWQFLSQDIWPRSLISGDWSAALQWYRQELVSLLPAAAYTLIISVVALVLTGLLVMVLYPLASQPLAGRWQMPGHGLLLMVRSTPEVVLAFVLLLVFGPSALPAILALAIHNSGLIGYLIARDSDQLPLRADAPAGFNLYSYELNPRLYPRLLGLLLYRWEVIMRESAILGLLGVTTLGFYVDSAFEEIRYDRALLLVMLSAALNIAIDSLSRRLRAHCHLGNPARELTDKR